MSLPPSNPVPPTSDQTPERLPRAGRRIWLRLVLFMLGLYAGLCLFLAWDTVRAKQGHLSRTPAALRLPYEEVTIPSADHILLQGWFIPAPGKAKGVVVCCHGVDSTRLAMLEPARILHNAGYAVLLFDFRARGESGGSRCTLGYRETEDLLAAIRYVTSRTEMRSVPLGVLGESMGGAVALMGTARAPAVRCVIAESPFSRLDHAVANHFHYVLGGAGPILGVPTRWIGRPAATSR